MKMLRNLEVKNILLLHGVTALAATLLSFLWEVRFGFLMLAVCILYTVLYMSATIKRYRRISNLAADINQILHGDCHISIEQYAEGELGILQSEIYKMIDRLANEGLGILMISSEVPEVLGVSDRVVVMCRGRVTGEYMNEGIGQDVLLKAASSNAGGERDE